jgi:hypothetical protein
MSYSLETPCFPCLKKNKCTDQASISGAISGIHQMPHGVGHLGSGKVTLSCYNLEKQEETEPDH